MQEIITDENQRTLYPILSSILGTEVLRENYRLLQPSHWRRIFLSHLIPKGHSPNPLVRYKWCPSALWLCAVIRRCPGNKPREWCQKLTSWRAWQIWTWMVSRLLRYCTFSKLTILNSLICFGNNRNVPTRSTGKILLTYFQQQEAR